MRAALIALTDPQEDEETHPDFSDCFAFHPNLRPADALNHSSHVPACPSKNKNGNRTLQMEDGAHRPDSERPHEENPFRIHSPANSCCVQRRMGMGAETVIRQGGTEASLHFFRSHRSLS